MIQGDTQLRYCILLEGTIGKILHDFYWSIIRRTDILTLFFHFPVFILLMIPYKLFCKRFCLLKTRYNMSVQEQKMLYYYYAEYLAMIILFFKLILAINRTQSMKTSIENMEVQLPTKRKKIDPSKGDQF